MQAGVWPRSRFALVDRGVRRKKSLEAWGLAFSNRKSHPAPGENNSPGPRKSCYRQPGLVTCPGLSFPLSPSKLLPFTHLYVGLHSYFPFSKHTGIFFKTGAFFQISPEPVDPCQQSCGSLPECEAAAGPTPGGTVSPSVYTFLRAIALGRLCESGTQPGAVLVTLKFLLQFCQI